VDNVTQIHDNHVNSTPAAVTSAMDDTDIAIPSVRLSVRDRGHSRIMSKRLKGIEIGRTCFTAG